ncbi:MAG: PL29 family lyase N-terminal domain-containing protein [Rikenellaceae bacterium]
MKRKILHLAAIALLLGGTSTLKSCQYDDSLIWDEIESLKEDIAELNSSVSAMQTIIDALENGSVITSVTETETGYTITFSNGESIEITNGSNAPVISVIEVDGVYYWATTQNGETTALLDDNGDMIPVTAQTPTVDIDDEGYWTVNGERITDSNGNPIKAEAGDSFFKDIVETDTYVTFILSDGTTIVVPKATEFNFTIEGLNLDETLSIKYGETATFSVTASGVAQWTVNRPYGWEVSFDGDELSITAPESGAAYSETSGEIALTLVSNSGLSSIVKFQVNAYEIRVLTFEDEDYKGTGNYLGYSNWSSLIDDPQYMGVLLYGESGWGASVAYEWNDENNTFLHSKVIESYGYYAFWNGGHAISNYTLEDITLSGYGTQLSVPCVDAATSMGGYNGSNNFCVHYGYIDDQSWSTEYPAISFSDGEARTVLSMQVISTSMLAKYVVNCNGENEGISSDQYVNIVAMGYNGNTATGEVIFEIANGEDGFIAEWTQWDLSSLGDVTRIEFNMTGNVTGEYGFDAPAYFAYDNVTVLF